MQCPAGRFVLNGEEIDLGVGPQASMAHRVEALRLLLEQRLGFDTFMKYVTPPLTPLLVSCMLCKYWH